MKGELQLTNYFLQSSNIHEEITGISKKQEGENASNRRSRYVMGQDNDRDTSGTWIFSQDYVADGGISWHSEQMHSMPVAMLWEDYGTSNLS